MDGSSAPFVKLIEEVGVVEQGLPRRTIRVLRPVTVRDGDKFVTICHRTSRRRTGDRFRMPGNWTSIPPYAMSNGAFWQRLGFSPFRFLHEVEALQAAGWRAAALDNAVVLSDGEVLNEGGLRHDEFVRKILDCLGDLPRRCPGAGTGYGQLQRARSEQCCAACLA